MVKGKRACVFWAGLIILASASVALFVIILSPEGEYMHFREDWRGGEETRVLLIDSRLYYGVYEESFHRTGYSVEKGDPCIIINGTIRNDYDKGYYFCITADVYNSKGEKVEPILTIHSPVPYFTVAYAKRGSAGVFVIQIPYEGKDVEGYRLWIIYNPMETPPA